MLCGKHGRRHATDARRNPREYIRDIENRRIPQLKEDIAPFERGEMQIRSHNGSKWMDDTPVAIDRTKAIEQYERILANLKKKLA